MILDDLMPAFDVVERHSTVIHANAATVFAAVRSADLSSGVIPRTLLVLRGLPAAILSPRKGLAELERRWRREEGETMRLSDCEARGFRVVAERAPDELVIGLLGKFWTPTGGICADVSAETFAAGPPAGLALAGWNFSVVPRGDALSELRTETRVWCAPDVRLKFKLYWLIVQPGSGLIRHAMLRAIKHEAEKR